MPKLVSSRAFISITISVSVYLQAEVNALVALQAIPAIKRTPTAGKRTAKLAQVVKANLVGAQLDTVRGDEGAVLTAKFASLCWFVRIERMEG